MSDARKKPPLETVFKSLRGALTPLEKRLAVAHDGPEDYTIVTKVTRDDGRPMFFGAVRLGKAGVSFHLMPVYVFPELLKGLPKPLLARMHGKSCFNFTEVSPAELRALRRLAAEGLTKFRKALLA